MTSAKPSFPVTGGVGPWVTSFNIVITDRIFLRQFFKPADAKIVEIAPTPDGTDFQCTTTLLSSIEAKEWSDLSDYNQPACDKINGGVLRLIILPFNTNDDDAPPFSWKGLQEHLDLLHLRSSYIYDEKMHTPPGWFEVPLDGDLKGFVVKPEKWDSNLSNYSLSVAYSPVRRITTVVAHMLRKRDVEYLLGRLQTMRSVAWHPLLVALILMEGRIEKTADNLTFARNSLYGIEQRTGTHKNYHGKSRHDMLNYYAYGKKVWEEREEGDIGFETAPGKLTSIVSDCVMFEAKCIINEDLLAWFQGLNVSLHENKASHKQLSDLSTGAIRMKISAMLTWSSNNRSRSIYLAKRAEAQMQASLSLMAQRDNALNMKTAEAAVRDSSDMRAIAWVTLAFLPATFVATFFSTSFFNFEQEGHRVSNLVWLYGAVSVGLTASVLAGWALWVRREHRSDRGTSKRNA